jgi:hypothetical protein
MATLPQVINVLSNGKFTVGANGNVSTDQLSVLEEIVADDVAQANPGFTGNQLLTFKSCYILHILDNNKGSGQVIEKTVKDTRWKLQSFGGTSYWMTYAANMVAQFKSNAVYNIAFSQVLRSDAVMERLQLDNTGSPQYGDPSRGEWN